MVLCIIIQKRTFALHFMSWIPWRMVGAVEGSRERNGEELPGATLAGCGSKAVSVTCYNATALHSKATARELLCMVLLHMARLAAARQHAQRMYAQLRATGSASLDVHTCLSYRSSSNLLVLTLMLTLCRKSDTRR